jgi:hypothetical protein
MTKKFAVNFTANTSGCNYLLNTMILSVKKSLTSGRMPRWLTHVNLPITDYDEIIYLIK